METFFLFLNLLFSPAQASLDQCLKDKKVDLCRTTAGQLRALGNFDGAYKALKQLCDISFESDCSNLLYDSLKLSNEIQKQTVELFKSKCKEKDSQCEHLAIYYHEIKDYKNALVYYKKYFLATNKGVYPYYEFQHGSKEEAYKYSLQHCESGKDTKYQDCVFYVRYMPEHPELGRLVSLSEESCRTDNTSTGATSCAILGSYYYMRNLTMQAFSVWDLDCKRGNATACLSILGSEQTTDSQKQMTANNLCRLPETQTVFPGSQDVLRNCPIPDASEVPKGMLEAGKQILKDYLEEQK